MEEEEGNEPLLSSAGEVNDANQRDPRESTFTFHAAAGDIAPIEGIRDFFTQYLVEFKKLWFLAAPLILSNICTYLVGAVTQVFAGHVSTLALAAVVMQNAVIAGFCSGILIGMGCALKTLCGQAFGAGKVEMLGIYFQRSCIILTAGSTVLSTLYIFAGPILRLIGQTEDIARATGIFSLWMIPEVFAYGFNYAMNSFLQVQSKIMVLTAIMGVAAVLNTAFGWLLILKLKWGLVGAAIVLNVTWFLINVAQFLYIISGRCGHAWTGFSFKAFHDLWGFAKLSLASGVMICLEIWYYMALILIAGYLKDAELSVDALSICINILGLSNMVAYGFCSSTGVRVSNELGAAHPRRAKFSLVVAVISSICVGFIFSLLLIIFRNIYPSIYSNDPQVQDRVKDLTPLLALCILINSVQPVFSGVAIGAGWQKVVAYVNIGCYYLFGVPLGLILGFALNMGVKGIWCGMLSGTVLQTCVLFGIICKTNWNKEASMAEERIKKWGG